MTNQYHNIRRFVAYTRPPDRPEDFRPLMEDAYYEGVILTDGTTVIHMNDGSATTVFKSLSDAVSFVEQLRENIDFVFFDEPGKLDWEVEDFELDDEEEADDELLEAYIDAVIANLNADTIKIFKQRLSASE